MREYSNEHWNAEWDSPSGEMLLPWRCSPCSVPFSHPGCLMSGNPGWKGSVVLVRRTKPESQSALNLMVKLVYIFLLSHLAPENIQVTSASKHWTFPFSLYHLHVKDTTELSREIWETEVKEIMEASGAAVVTAPLTPVHLSPPYWEFFSPSHKGPVSVTATCVGSADAPCWLGELCVPDLGGVQKPRHRQDVFITDASPTQVLCVAAVTQPLKL